ncbi:MAG: response regulator transcription factor [Prevotella sp.]|nr:response regulator transcription factor [Prevotella sp.]
MTINCAIIDDEPLAAGLLESYARKTPFLHLLGTYNSAITAMKELREHPADLIFLDIQMPELSGIEFAKILPSQTKIIFTTAFQQYAIEGYKVSALDYLLKPISYDDFVKSANKALEWFTIAHRQQTYAQDRFMFVKSDYKLQRVALDDILYIEGLKDYVRIYLQDGQKIMSLMNMKKLEDYLPRPEFLRTHRSYIVHMTKAATIDRFRIVFGEQYIPISDSYKEEVQNYFDEHTLS